MKTHSNKVMIQHRFTTNRHRWGVGRHRSWWPHLEVAHIFCPNRIASQLDSQNIQTGKAKRLKQFAVSKKLGKKRAIWIHLIGSALGYPCHMRYGIQVQKDFRTRHLFLRNSLSNSLKHLDRSCQLVEKNLASVMFFFNPQRFHPFLGLKETVPCVAEVRHLSSCWFCHTGAPQFQVFQTIDMLRMEKS